MKGQTLNNDKLQSQQVISSTGLENKPRRQVEQKKNYECGQEVDEQLKKKKTGSLPPFNSIYGSFKSLFITNGYKLSKLLPAAVQCLSFHI